MCFRPLLKHMNFTEIIHEFQINQFNYTGFNFNFNPKNALLLANYSSLLDIS
jgi:hypothetical protein